jgi:hypothetical protein
MLNVAVTIDKMVAEIPGNRELQIDLGIITSEDDPFEEFQQINWNHSDRRDGLYDLASLVADNDLSRTGNDDSQKKALLTEMIVIVSRRLVLRQIISKKYVVNDIPHDQLAIYARVAEDGWVTRLNELANSLKIIEDRREVENGKLAKLFG